ncbi:fasciculation and elongation protein zeta-2-like isoform X5 [Pseudoliparis swirei]|uniref:fasciculation and elongation protein zeta-2-like isoform X5 n=1 Tax=Pseudoliparis swirei TaxID=2059687 RepID=UPI0024BECE44|nr:fasciculation and elongation protein zeta-2-like isoform X5 [Pseudoliparis swirei]
MAAPLAHFDEDWQDFNEFQPASTDQLDQLNSNVGEPSSGLDDFSDLDNSFSGEICSFKSMEDLVQDFDEKLTVCFRNYNTATENIAPVKPITEDNYLKDDEVWNALTDNYGNVMPVDWKTSHTRSLHLPTLNIIEYEKSDNQSLDLSDDEELREQMDMHSIIVSSISDEPLYTAEQVIEELEEMMQESPDPEADASPSQSDLSMLSQDLHALKRSGSHTSYEDRLRQLSVSELTKTLEEVETAIRYSEELIQALALRDELDYEKELLTLEGLSNVIQHGLRQTFGSTGGDKQYLTTVIPYEKKTGSPVLDDLQILTKILRAMRDDSEKVPALLTDYILKGKPTIGAK